MAFEQTQREKAQKKLRRNEWKMIKRKRRRKAQALRLKAQTPLQGKTDQPEQEETDEETLESEVQFRIAVEEENERQNAEWERRDMLAHQLWLEKKEQEERERQKREETERKIREEWEERERQEKEEQDKILAEQTKRREKQDSLLQKATENEHKAWENSEALYRYRASAAVEENVSEANKCPFFTKTGACRFGDRCSRVHLRPEKSTTLLIGGMFDSFELKKSCIDDYDTDMHLEYEDKELYRTFREFYHDVVPEFKTVGRVMNVKVCCNHEQHLRGNVYVQYKSEKEAYDAFIKFNARWYGGQQLTCEFVNIAKWKSAICGLFFAKRCPKGKTCNFLHVFRNPGNEFWEADRDFQTSTRRERGDETPIWHPGSERHSHHDRRSWSRSWSRTSDVRSHRGHHRSTRSRSRSPRSRSRSPRSRSRSPRNKSRSPRSRSRSPRNRFRSSRSRSKSPTSRSQSRRKSRDRSNKRESVPRSKRKGRGLSEKRESVSRSKIKDRDQSEERESVSRSRMHSRDRSEERKSLSKKRRSRSRSEESRSEKSKEKKHKKSKHKKSKTSGKEKKRDKRKNDLVEGPVVLQHLAYSEGETETVQRDGEVCNGMAQNGVE